MIELVADPDTDLYARIPTATARLFSARHCSWPITTHTISGSWCYCAAVSVRGRINRADASP
jgi:hypothetical protein